MNLEKCKPEQQGICPDALEKMFDYWDEKGTQVHSCAIVRGGKLIALRNWEPHKVETPHMLNSMSKTFTAIGVMFAMQEGLLSEKDTVISFFPEIVGDIGICENMKKMRIEHLLTMTTGHYPDSADFIITHKDPIKAFLASDVSIDPGTRYVYNTGATYMLSIIIGIVSGKSLYDYLKTRLFEPLGIKDAFWETDSQGNSYGGFGLNISITDAAKTGLFLLRRGFCDGKQLLSAELIDKATSALVETSDMEGQEWLDILKRNKEWKRTDWDCGYGWQIWRCEYSGAYRADGAFGQYCVVIPDRGLVVAIFSGSNCAQYLLRGIWDYLIPGCDGFGGTAEEVIPEIRKSVCVNGGQYPESDAAKSLIGSALSVPANPLGISAILLHSPDLVEFDGLNGKFGVRAGYCEWIYSDLGFGSPSCSFPFIIRPYSRLNSCFAFDGDAYVLRMLCDGYAYYHEIRFTAKGDDVILRCDQYPGSESFEVLCTRKNRE